jgi:hypothetical protein
VTQHRRPHLLIEGHDAPPPPALPSSPRCLGAMIELFYHSGKPEISQKIVVLCHYHAIHSRPVYGLCLDTGMN